MKIMAGSDRHLWSKPDTANRHSSANHAPGTQQPSRANMPVISLQRTIGNRAVQRLLGDEIQNQHTKLVQRKDNSANKDIGSSDSQSKESQSIWLLSLTKGADKTKIKGDSKIPGHEGKIELLSFSVEFAQPDSSGKKSSETINIVKHTDSTSQTLLNASQRGEHIAFEVEGGKLGPDNKFTSTWSYASRDGLVTNFVTSQGSGNDPPSDRITLTTDRIDFSKYNMAGAKIKT